MFYTFCLRLLKETTKKRANRENTMAFHFFTLGGRQYWEDVFYYQKWRIQRHFRTHKYRLLDPWDIRRESGSFEVCRQAFIKAIEVYEIDPQNGSLVVLLYGLGKNKTIFQPLIEKLNDENISSVVMNYPSRQKSFEEHLEQLSFFLTHLEGITSVSFITEGSGCLLLRHLLASNFLQNKKINIKKVININPINTGSETCAYLSRFKIFNFLFGPSLKECSPTAVESLPFLSESISLGLIFCETYYQKLLKFLIHRYQSVDIPSEKKETDFSEHRISVLNYRLNIFKNKNLILSCVRFLREGTFQKF